MNIQLQKAQLSDLPDILKYQKESFKQMYERYKDDEISPYNESIESLQESLDNRYLYKILAEGKMVGSISISKNPDEKHLQLDTIYIIPEQQNKGIAQETIKLVEKEHSETTIWELTTPADAEKNIHFYEKMGYRRTEKEDIINENLTLIHFKKIVLRRYSNLYEYKKSKMVPIISSAFISKEDKEYINNHLKDTEDKVSEEKSKEELLDALYKLKFPLPKHSEGNEQIPLVKKWSDIRVIEYRLISDKPFIFLWTHNVSRASMAIVSKDYANKVINHSFWWREDLVTSTPIKDTNYVMVYNREDK